MWLCLRSRPGFLRTTNISAAVCEPWLLAGSGIAVLWQHQLLHVSLAHHRYRSSSAEKSKGGTETHQDTEAEKPHPSDAAGIFPPACSLTGTGIHSLEDAASLCWACRKEDFKNRFFSNLCLGCAIYILN